MRGCEKKSVSSTLPKKSPEEAPSTIVVATPDGKDVADFHKLGWRAYVKDMINLSVLRGKLCVPTPWAL